MFCECKVTIFLSFSSLFTEKVCFPPPPPSVKHPMIHFPHDADAETHESFVVRLKKNKSIFSSYFFCLLYYFFLISDFQNRLQRLILYAHTGKFRGYYASFCSEWHVTSMCLRIAKLRIERCNRVAKPCNWVANVLPGHIFFNIITI